MDTHRRFGVVLNLPAMTAHDYQDYTDLARLCDCLIPLSADAKQLMTQCAYLNSDQTFFVEFDGRKTVDRPQAILWSGLGGL